MIIPLQQRWPATLTSYLIGFGLSLLLTAAAYLLVGLQLLESVYLIILLMGLALLQAYAQLLFFLHLGKESHPRWNILVFFLMLSTLAIVVLGSLWIMAHLNERVMPSLEAVMAPMEASMDHPTAPLAPEVTPSIAPSMAPVAPTAPTPLQGPLQGSTP
jgi:cytochrome o ubiquinol oxidase operon protein cyoD